ncbi:voltage and ligand gated potassium channel, putative [Pediculus humanus corporis]|uniref:Voltage and ligand gated potassium channel, putative n=1 Tax=Pediculus humanus subsp. corporis TaxID=121224 RepID=E0V9V2_PEDHC|nr:voltage and ligand gated potassium channel, putative [Pediculus humanus corporis]EEB10158.1 voltage and ligand gated potassium channel, putative [Pediculus humanus corporis]
MDFLEVYSLPPGNKPKYIPKIYDSEKVENNKRFNRFLLFILLGVYIRFIMTLYDIGFRPRSRSLETFNYITVVLDAFYFLDVISQIIYRKKWPKSTSRLKKNAPYLSRLVWRNNMFLPRPIWMLVFDIISLLPFSLVKNVYVDSTYIFLWEFPSALRVYRVLAHYGSEAKKISPSTNKSLGLFLRAGMFWMILSHTLACIWGYVLDKIDINFSIRDNSTNDLKDEKPFHYYIFLFYFVFTGLTNIGFGDIIPTSDGEKLLESLVMLVGFILLKGYLIATLTSVLTEKARRLTYLKFRLSLMSFEMARNLNLNLISLHYKKGIGILNRLLLTLPDSFSIQVYNDLFVAALNTSLLFRSCDEFSKRAIARIMRVELFMAGDAILKRRKFNSKMFYVRKGTIHIMSYQDDATEVMTFGAGTIFGQISLLLSLPAKSEVHAATFCEIHSLSRKRLFRVLKDYAHAKKIIQNVHKNMLLNAMADKSDKHKRKAPGNLLTTYSFYKVPIETSKLARDDICIVTRCPYIFMPDTIFIKAWNVLITIIIIFICFYYPYQAAFAREYKKDLEPLFIIVDLVFLLNLYLSLSTSVIRENVLFSSLRDIVPARLTTLNTVCEIIAIIPAHYFIWHTNRLKSVILCLKCVMFYKVHLVFKTAEWSYGKTTIFLLRLIKYVLYFLFGAYIIGIVFYMEACYVDPCLQDSWYVTTSSPNRSEPIWVSFYFAIIVISGTGFGDIVPNNITDIIYVIGFIIFGVLLLIYLIADYSANLSLSREPRINKCNSFRQEFIELAERVNSFLRSQKMLKSERTRVRHFLNLQWERNSLFTHAHTPTQGYEFTSENRLFYDMPKHLLYTINQFTRTDGSEILGNLLNSSIRRIFPPHEVVIYAGEICDSLIILEQGYCEVTYGKDTSITKIIHAGQDIGLVEFMLDMTSFCHVRTLTHCVIIKLQSKNLIRAFSLNPIIAAEFKKSIEIFAKSPILKDAKKNQPVLLHLTVRKAVQESFYRFRYYRKQGGNQELRDPYLKLGLCQWLRYLLFRVTVLPYGNFLKRWEFSRCIFAFLSSLIFPCLPYFELEFGFLYYLSIILDITAWVDMYFRCHVCYYNKQNILVTHPLWTLGHYLKGNFVLDFIFSFPFDRILYRPIYDVNDEAIVSSNANNLLRILRVGQVYRIPVTLSTAGVDFLSPPHLYWVIATATILTTTFVNLATIEFPTLPSYVFIVNFYWTCTTAFGVGFGDIVGSTQGLMIYVNIVILVCKYYKPYLYFNYVTVIIASYLTRINMNLTMFQQGMSHLISFLKVENVEPMLRKHIINHFEYIWKKNRAFSNLGSAFHRLLCSKLDEIHFQSGAAIYKPGDVLSQFYIVHQGEVTLVGKTENETVELGRSKIFGIFKNLPTDTVSLSAVATKNVTILGIDSLMLYSILKNYKKSHDDQINDQDIEFEFQDALYMSNTISTEWQEGTQSLSTSKYYYQLVYLTYNYSKFILVFYVVLSLYTANIVTFNLAFQYNSKIAYIIDLFIEFLFVVKIVIEFFKGYLNDFGEFVSDLRLISKRYMKTASFYLDILSTFPFEIFSLIMDKEDKRNYLATWLRMTKLLRLYNVWYFFNLRFDTLSVNMILLKIMANTVWTTTLVHQCSCLWYFVSCPNAYCPNSKLWNRIKRTAPDNTEYVNCFYFIIAIMTTTGLGDLSATTVTEIMCVIFFCFVFFFYTAIFIGEMVSSTNKYLFSKTKFEYEVEELKNYLIISEIPYENQKLILKYVVNLWRNEKGKQVPDILKFAPTYLVNEIKLSTYGGHIKKNPLFKNCSQNFQKQLIYLLIRTVFYFGDVIVFEGQASIEPLVDKTAYFVHSGQVVCKNCSDKTIYREYSFFGLSQCVKESLPHHQTFVANSSCVILSLNITKAKFLIKFFPEDMKYIVDNVNAIESNLM